ncbi:disintegrin and metalloproteinase domain-containing protein 10-like [Mytilus galloprovincialis]|uniref:disintegrin and metalloproteinase domain-containing protein 10-like n=1 Tax=Mytilus galloprovincialis TaxID=29158 RepID=UPI003F7B534E
MSVTKPSYLTYCNSYLKVCVDGLCTGSVCSKIDYVPQNKVTWVECFVQSAGDTVADKERQCLLGCKVNNTDTCYSSDGDLKLGPFLLLLQEIKNATLSENVKLSAGSPCNNYKGYCDTFQRCQDVIEKMDTSAESISDTQCWNLKHWWIVLLLAKGLV